MLELKTIDKNAIPAALEKVEQYRLLNEPRDAESICRDILAVDPDHQEALRQLILSLTDQFASGRRSVRETRELIPRLESDYGRLYYAGIIAERWGKAQHEQGDPGFAVYESLCKAMDLYERAEACCPTGEDAAKLRWNTCARIINRNETIRPRDDQEHESLVRDHQ